MPTAALMLFNELSRHVRSLGRRGEAGLYHPRAGARPAAEWQLLCRRPGTIHRAVGGRSHVARAFGDTQTLPDGRVIAVATQPIPGGGWVVTHTDVTESSAARKELEQTRNFLHTVIENVPASIMVRDANDRRYVLVNRATEQLYGVGRECCSERPPRRRLSERDRRTPSKRTTASRSRTAARSKLRSTRSRRPATAPASSPPRPCRFSTPTGSRNIS